MKELIPPKVDGDWRKGCQRGMAGSSFLANILAGIIEFRVYITL